MNKFDFIQNFYLKNNLKIFPIMENKKLPLIDAWQRDCSSNLNQVLYWLENAKGCNIGLPANENNLFIIDIDMHDINGIESWNRLLRDLNISEIHTLMQTTPSGGVHYIFKSDDELKNVMNSSNSFKDYPGIDIRTKGYILVEPSVIDGKPYKLYDTDVNKMPNELRKFILNCNKHEVEVRKKDSYTKPERVEKGGRDTSLFDYINQLYYKTKLDEEDIKLLAYNFNRTICDPPLSDGVVDYKINKLFKKKRNRYILINIGDETDE